jgi:ATP-dependent exoDNAse (exonuclease V) alpha subunit
MALYHFSVKQISRGKGQTVVGSAAYISGEKLYNEYYDETHDYTRKRGVLFTEIMAPDYVPKRLHVRETLWNEVERVEKNKRAQLAYSFNIALQNELTIGENIELARQFCMEQFVSRGMIVDMAVHEGDSEDPVIPDNPHFHVIIPIRPVTEDGSWGSKQKREYLLDSDGNRVRDKNGNYVFNAVSTTGWNSPELLAKWREAWADTVNDKFRANGLAARVDHRSYAEQGIDLIPTVHEGYEVRAMEKKGIRTVIGEINRLIKRITTREIKSQTPMRMAGKRRAIRT